MGSLEDLINCKEGREEIPDHQVGKGEEMRLSDSLMNSEVSLDQQGMLIEEDQRSILIIGEIDIFLPKSPVEARACVAYETIEEGQPTSSIIEEEEKENIIQQNCSKFSVRKLNRR
jgi:hypothetical protein